jgi:hypothetical protein
LLRKNCIYQKPIRERNQIHRGCTTKNKGHNTAYKRECLDTKGTPKLTRSSPNKPPSPKHPKPNPIQPKNYTESVDTMKTSFIRAIREVQYHENSLLLFNTYLPKAVEQLYLSLQRMPPPPIHTTHPKEGIKKSTNGPISPLPKKKKIFR